MIERHIAREHKPKEIGKYFPSEVGNCLRKVWYSYRYPMKLEPETLKIFEVGNMLHGFVVEVLKSDKNKDIQLVQYEFPFKLEIDDFLVSGRVDDLLLIKVSGKEVLLEVKSTKDVSRIRKPQSNHLIQLQFYMYATGVHNGSILYIDKNNLQSKSFEAKFSAKDSSRIVERFKELHRHLTANKLPMAEAKAKDDMKWMCKFCEYFDKCDKNSL